MQNEITGIFGRKRQGKTRLLLRLLQERIDQDKKKTCIFYVDPKGGEYPFGVLVSDYGAIVEGSKTAPFTYRIVIKKWNVAAFNWVCEKAMEVASREGTGKVILAIDEAQKFSTQYVNPPGLELVLDDGPWRGLDIYFTTHRPIDVHANLRAACDRLAIFQTHHSADIGVFQKYADIPDETFKSLKKGDYINWHVEEGYKVVSGDTQ